MSEGTKQPAEQKVTKGRQARKGEDAEKPLTGNFRPDGGFLGIDEYERTGGYQALRKALQAMKPAEVVQVISDADLKGRGGAGFPAGKKWQFIPTREQTPRPIYMIANADEMEPGTFKDRLLMESNPHQLIEGTILAAYAIQANLAYIFLRWAYRLSAQRLRQAISEAHDHHYLGEHILGSDYKLDLRLHISAGRYICGEATALLDALEGKRAVPRAKPPHAANSGLWGSPTVVNNVETLCNVPHIVNRGAEWFKSLGLGQDSGTKIFQASGRVNRPGAWELPMGTTLREILEEHAGGMRQGYVLRGLLPGGASTEFLLPEQLDVKMDFDAIKEAGSRFGTATIIVLDDQTCPVGMVGNLMRFFARESCGWCTPCRDTLPWVSKTLDALENGKGDRDDLTILDHHAHMIVPGHAFCDLAPGAMEPLRSALEYFRDDLERHIELGRCPWK